jgi:hypothetical protein
MVAYLLSETSCFPVFMSQLTCLYNNLLAWLNVILLACLNVILLAFFILLFAYLSEGSAVDRTSGFPVF